MILKFLVLFTALILSIGPAIAFAYCLAKIICEAMDNQ